MKRCFKCEDVLPLSEFYRHPMMADGHLGKCKACTKNDVRTNRLDRPDHYREYERRRYQEPGRHARMLAQGRKYNAKWPEKREARRAVLRAVRAGRLRRLPCEVCGVIDVHGHHSDYGRPLDVKWLCVKHHAEVHAAVRKVA